VTAFFRAEFDETVAAALRRDLPSGRRAYHTFNVFNVRIDPDARVVTVEDVLDPDREEGIDFAEFTRLLDEYSPEAP
jgi:hypothetical protein